MQQKATSLPYGLFANCTGLAGDVVIPDGVTTLGGDLFYGCSNLKGTLTIPSSVTRADSENSFATSGFTSIVNNSTQEFFGPAIALGTVDYFANDSGEKVQTIGSGTYTRKTRRPSTYQRRRSAIYQMLRITAIGSTPSLS